MFYSSITVQFTVKVNNKKVFFDDATIDADYAFQIALDYAREEAAKGKEVTLFSEPNGYFHDIQTGAAIKDETGAIQWIPVSFEAIDPDKDLPF